ncbi:unnamed protein product [Litomosoides sigmodontis]|uniref:Fatty acid hydroxylase domain-containing protein n=1 Tax=Litomosoides sigmodontis TaxID=42156 RepID=A0A3P6TFV0_LITSI|nr:unnamed protein product [Litomosoides sigmodontis]
MSRNSSSSSSSSGGSSGSTVWLDYTIASTSLGQRILYRLHLKNLRYAYYLITPNETMFEHEDEVPNYTTQVSLWWFLFIVTEFCLLLLRGHGDRFALNDSITSVSAGILSQCFKFGGRTIAIFLYDYIWNNFRLVEGSWDSASTWIFCLFFQDFMYYLGHRAIHDTLDFFGEFIRYITVPSILTIQQLCDRLLFKMLGLPSTMFYRPFSFRHRHFWSIDTLARSINSHCIPLLGMILNTPSHHRVHHGRNPYCIDRNYAAVFIIWDKMFGTFEPERQFEKPVYGTISRERTFNQLYLQFHALYEVLFVKWRMKTEKGECVFRGIEKLKAIYYPPIYMPGMKVRRYFHWFSMVDHEEGIPMIMMRNKAVAQALLEKKIYAPYQEILRCVGVTAHYFYSESDELFISEPNRLFMIAIYMSSAAFWSIYIVLHIDAVSHENIEKDSKMKQIATIQASDNAYHSKRIKSFMEL